MGEAGAELKKNALKATDLSALMQGVLDAAVIHAETGERVVVQFKGGKSKIVSRDHHRYDPLDAEGFSAAGKVLSGGKNWLLSTRSKGRLHSLEGDWRLVPAWWYYPAWKLWTAAGGGRSKDQIVDL